MKKTLLLSCLCAAFFSINYVEVFACSCFPPTSDDVKVLVDEEFKNSASVFAGEAVEVIRNEKQGFVQVKFRTEKIWKGGGVKFVTLKTGLDDGDCGYEFSKGKKYLVYTRGDNINLRTDICTRTGILEKNDDVKLLNALNKSKAKSFPK